jgi:hypothetical protein
MDSTDSQNNNQNNDNKQETVVIDGVELVVGLVDNLLANGFFTAEAVSTAFNFSTDDSEDNNSESDGSITPVPPPGVKIGSWNRIQSKEPMPSHYTKSNDWDILAMIIGLGRLVTDKNGMPMVGTRGINLPAGASRTAQRTKFFYIRNALQVNEFGSGYLDGFPGYPQVNPSYYYGVGITSGYVTYELLK